MCPRQLKSPLDLTNAKALSGSLESHPYRHRDINLCTPSTCHRPLTRNNRNWGNLKSEIRKEAQTSAEHAALPLKAACSGTLTWDIFTYNLKQCPVQLLLFFINNASEVI